MSEQIYADDIHISETADGDVETKIVLRIDRHGAAEAAREVDGSGHVALGDGSESDRLGAERRRGECHDREKQGPGNGCVKSLNHGFFLSARERAKESRGVRPPLPARERERRPALRSIAREPGRLKSRSG